MDSNPILVPPRDRRSGQARTQLLNRIRAEFREMPCLRLTCRQAQRLFGMRADVCERVFATLIGEGFLTCGHDARYGRPADLAWRAYSASAAGQEGAASRAS